MEQNYGYNREEEIDLVSVLALGFRHLKFVLICAFIGLVLFLGIHILNTKTEKAAQDYFEKSEQYEAKIAALQNTIDSTSEKIDFLNHYNNESCLMKLNPNSFYSAKVILSISCDEKMIVENKGNAFSPVAVVKSNYNSLWSSVNLSELFGYEIPSNLLREVVQLEGVSDDNSIITVRADANSSDEALNMAEALGNYLVSVQQSVSDVSYNHQLTKGDTFVQKSFNEEIATKQIDTKKQFSTLTDELLKSKEELKKLEKEMPALRHFAKYSAIGFFVGFFLACLYLLVAFIGKGSVYSSAFIAEWFNLTYFGSLNSKEKLFLHEKILNEKLWNKKDAEQFISENIRNRIPEGSRVLVMSSGAINNENAATVLSCLEGQKMVPSLVGNVPTNAESVGSVKNCDCIILLEKTWTARRCDVEQSVLLAEKFDKQIAGFISVLD